MLLEPRTVPPPASAVRDLVAEANHRIANSLAAVAGLVQHQMVGLGEDRRSMPVGEVRQMLDGLRVRVNAVARLHRALSEVSSEARIDLGRYLQQIAAELVSSLSGRSRVELHFACELGCRTTPDRALYVGLVVVELVTNALKYAHPAGVSGKIDMHCWRTPGSLIIEIADDGVGFPDGFDAARSPTKGLRIIRSLLQQIGGSIEYQSHDLGLTCTVSAPVLTAECDAVPLTHVSAAGL